MKVKVSGEQGSMEIINEKPLSLSARPCLKYYIAMDINGRYRLLYLSNVYYESGSYAIADVLRILGKGTYFVTPSLFKKLELQVLVDAL